MVESKRPSTCTFRRLEFLWKRCTFRRLEFRWRRTSWASTTDRDWHYLLADFIAFLIILFVSLFMLLIDLYELTTKFSLFSTLFKLDSVNYVYWINFGWLSLPSVPPQKKKICLMDNGIASQHTSTFKLQKKYFCFHKNQAHIQHNIYLTRKV